jgi:type IV pilus assembly protein PilP
MRPIFLLLTFPLLLSACGSGADEDLRQWMQSQYNDSKPRVQPVNPPTQFVPQAYEMVGGSDPFGSERMSNVLQGSSSAPVASSALLQSEQRRRKEPLEAVPMEEMAMVGVLNRSGRVVALVNVSGLLHQVQVGNYLGPNFGRVTKITESEISVREIVQDSVGEWSERQTTLQLKEEASR